MTITWNSLHLSSNDRSALIAQCRSTLIDQGYTLYDPFETVPGPLYPESVRLFVSPGDGDWCRIVGTVTPERTLQDLLGEPLSQLADCIALTLTESACHVQAFRGGQDAVDAQSVLVDYLKPGCTAHDLQQALNGHYDDKAQSSDAITDALPEDVQRMAQNLNQRQVNRLFNKLMGQVSKRLGGDRDAAQGLLAANRADWRGAGGRRLLAVADCLTLPEDWRTPDFVTLRDAYQMHRRIDRNPNATLYPGDDDALAAVPDALAYTPIYGGKPA